MSQVRMAVIQVDDDPLMTRLASRFEFVNLPEHELRQVLVGDGSSAKPTWADPTPVIVEALQAGRETVLIFDANVYDERGRKINSAEFVESLGRALATLPEAPTGRIVAFFVWSDDEDAAMMVLAAARKLGLQGQHIGKQHEHRRELQAALRGILG